MTFRIRPQKSADYPAIATLEAPIIGVDFTADDVARQAAVPSLVAVVAEQDGRVIGRASAGFMPQHTPEGDMRCLVAIDPAYRRRGVGSALWDALQTLLAKKRPNYLRANGDEQDPSSSRFAQKRGFVIAHHHLFQKLFTAAFNAATWTPHIEQAQARGFRFVPFALLHTPDAERRFFALYTGYDGEVPDADAEAPSFESWRKWAVEAADFSPDLWTVAIAPDGDWAGLTMLQKREGLAEAHIFMTGVTRQYRGQGLSVALKAATMLHAKEQGIDCITTMNHGSNQPILATNRKLGFQAAQSIYRMVKQCDW